MKPLHWVASLAIAAAMITSSTAAENLKSVSFDAITGWREDNHREALATFQRSCREIIAAGHGFKRAALFGGAREDWLELCQRSLEVQDARQFFEHHFRAYQVVDDERPDGLFTGYFEPEAEGSRTQRKGYQVPIYRKPADLAAFDPAGEKSTGLKYGRYENGIAMPYFTRQEIEHGALRGRGLEIAWLKDWADAFFIHIQGSGRIKLSDGPILRLAYAAKTGLPYTGIGGVLIERGILTKQSSSMQSIRSWMVKNPDAARALMWQNKSFVFFRETQIDDPALGALGAQQVNLTPRRSLAVDRSIWMFGTPVWLDTRSPPETRGGSKSIRTLMIAQDTGTAIKGFARGDVYWGWGEEAAEIAGHMKSPGTMTVLLPVTVADKLNLAQ
jgi:membrane-bound lytic murein transglycosylase A